MNKTLDWIRKIGNLANTLNYIYTANEIKLMISTLKAAVEELETKFNIKQPNLPKQFKFTPDKDHEIEEVK